MGMWIGQVWHERKQLDERARPAVGQNQRNAVPVSGPLVDEVDVHAVQLSAKLSGRVQLALLCSPIEFAGPILKQLPKGTQGRSPAPKERLVPDQAIASYECALGGQTGSLARCGSRTE